MLINSYAKINLYLDVLSKRPDGYHEIDTVFCTVELHDSLKFALTKNPEIKILSNIPELASDKNLVWLVAQRLRADFGFNEGLEITLDKQIPLAAGLGGGSSNAAITFLTLKKLLKLDFDDIYRDSVAAEYGSDINFFFHGGVAQGSSRGEIITLMPDMEAMELLLVNPGLAISSREAYTLVKPEETSKPVARLWFNRLEAGIVDKYPVVKDLIKELRDLGAEQAMMSGSGSTCFGSFKDKALQQKALAHFRQDKDYWCKVVRTLGRRQYQKCIQNLS